MTLRTGWVALLVVLLTFSGTVWADFYASKAGESSYDGSPALILRFTSALDEQTQLKNYVTVTPALDNGSDWQTLDDGFSWTLPFVEPNTTYQIRINPGLVSADGQPFRDVQINSQQNQRASRWSVTTRAMQPSASFAREGQYLTTQSPQALPVTVVNVDAIALDVFRVRDERLDAFLRDTFYQGRQYYSELNQLKNWADLVHTAQFEPEVRQHQRATVNLDIQPALTKFADGVYIAVLRKPGTYEYRYDTTFFTQSDIGLHVRVMDNQVQAFTHDLASGQPMANVDITWYWNDINAADRLTRRQAQTDEVGEARLNTNDTPDMIIARRGNQLSFLQTSRNRLDLSGYANVTERHQQMQGFFWGPRDLYRPGETVDINMLMRDVDGQKLPDLPLNMSVYDGRGNLVDDFVWRPNTQSNLYQHQIRLDTNAPTGSWLIMIDENRPFSGQYRFQVEEFLPERMSLTFYDNAIEDFRYLSSRQGSVPINAQYLYGAPAAGNRADAVVTVRAASKLFEQWPDHNFGDPTEQIEPQTLKLDEITLDDQGGGVFTMPSDWANVSTPVQYRVTASVYEEGGRPVTRTQNVLAIGYDDERLVGIDPQFEGRASSNASVKFNLQSVTPDANAAADRVSVKLVRKTRDYYWYFDDSDGWTYRWRGDSYVAWAQTLELSDTGETIELPLQWGDYELQATSADGVTTVFPFRTNYYWSSANANGQQPDIIDMILPQDHYAPGDIATVELRTEVRGPAVLQVESSDGVLYTDHFQLTAGMDNVSLPIGDDWLRHDLYVTLMVLSPADQVSEIAPQRALGISHLPIRRDDAVLDVTVTAPERVEPNTTVTAKIEVTNTDIHGSAPVWASVAMVDMGVLNITDYERPKPERDFYSARRFESTYVDLYGRIINNLGFNRIAQKFGGGFDDSDDDLSRGGDKPQSEVQIVSEFSSPVAVVDGRAEVSFDLPSFNGRVKWMVVVWSDAAYGSAEQEMTIADKLVTQLSMPRFLAMGDESQLTLDLHNLSGQDGQFDVSVRIDGSVESEYPSQTIKLKDREKTSLVIPVKAIDFSGQGEIELSVSNGRDIQLQRSWKLGVRAPFPLRTLRAQTVIEPEGSWTPQPVTSHLIDDTVQAQLTVSDRPAIAFESHVDYLLRYPYGCLEQTISSTYPWVLIDQSLFGELNMGRMFSKRFDQSYSDAFRRQQIEVGIERLLTKQKSNGSFGYWNSNSSVSLWGTAYAAELLQDAQGLGIAVNSQALEQAYNALIGQLRGATSADIWTDNRVAYERHHRAYASYVLAKAGRVSLSDLRRLFDQMVQTSERNSPLPWMHMAVAFKLTGDVWREQQALTQALNTERDQHRYYADYGSQVRDYALSLSLALESGFNTGDLVPKLEQALAERRWMSTQERISLVRLARAFSMNGQSWQGTIVTDSFTQPLNQDTAFNTLLNAEQLASLQRIDAGDKRLYANLNWQGVPLKAPEPYQLGMRIDRQYYDLDGQRIDFTQPVKSGTLLIARVSAQGLENRYPEALIVDLLPAGFELENQNLLNASVNLDDIQIEGENVGEFFRNWRVEFQEYRDDRFVAGVSLNAYSPTRLFYLVRAVTPGQYALPNAYVEDMYRPEFQSMSYTPGQVTIVAADR